MNRYLCVDNFNGMLALTIGEVYTSTRETENCIWVISDAGREEGYTRYTYFRKVESQIQIIKNFKTKDAEIGGILACLSKNKED